MYIQSGKVRVTKWYMNVKSFLIRHGFHKNCEEFLIHTHWKSHDVKNQVYANNELYRNIT